MLLLVSLLLLLLLLLAVCMCVHVFSSGFLSRHRHRNRMAGLTENSIRARMPTYVEPEARTKPHGAQNSTSGYFQTFQDCFCRVGVPKFGIRIHRARGKTPPRGNGNPHRRAARAAAWASFAARFANRCSSRGINTESDLGQRY